MDYLTKECERLFKDIGFDTAVFQQSNGDMMLELSIYTPENECWTESVCLGHPLIPKSDLLRQYVPNTAAYSAVPHYMPESSPWGKVQGIIPISNGIYEVSTARHGGIMICEDVATQILSEEALKIGFAENGYRCYEEDSQACVPLRELIDSNRLPDSYFKLKFGSLSEELIERFCNYTDMTLMRRYHDYWAFHENVGRTEKIGTDISSFEVGDKIEYKGDRYEVYATASYDLSGGKHTYEVTLGFFDSKLNSSGVSLVNFPKAELMTEGKYLGNDYASSRYLMYDITMFDVRDAVSSLQDNFNPDNEFSMREAEIGEEGYPDSEAALKEDINWYKKKLDSLMEILDENASGKPAVDTANVHILDIEPDTPYGKSTYFLVNDDTKRLLARKISEENKISVKTDNIKFFTYFVCDSGEQISAELINPITYSDNKPYYSYEIPLSKTEFHSMVRLIEEAQETYNKLLTMQNYKLHNFEYDFDLTKYTNSLLFCEGDIVATLSLMDEQLNRTDVRISVEGTSLVEFNGTEYASPDDYPRLLVEAINKGDYDSFNVKSENQFMLIHSVCNKDGDEIAYDGEPFTSDISKMSVQGLQQLLLNTAINCFEKNIGKPAAKSLVNQNEKEII